MSYIIPAIHLAALLRDQTMAVATLADLKKAVRIAKDGGPTLIPACYAKGEEFPQWSTHPNLNQVLWWLGEHQEDTLALDLETTYSGIIMCCGLWSVERALDDQGICIPFYSQGTQKYWNTIDELKIKEALFGAIKRNRIIGQNAAGFDVPMMKKNWGIDYVKLYADTMVAHSLVMPELPHGLAFMSSMFTDLSPYKYEFGESKEQKDDVDKWERVQDMPDMELRIYNLLDCFATALVWQALEPMMEAA